MNQSDIPTLRERLAELADAVGARPPGEAGVKAWLMALRDFPMPDVTDALDQWLRSKTKMPAPADIRLILSGRISDRLEQHAAAEKAQFAVGGKRIVTEAQRRLARATFDRIAAVLHAYRRDHDPDEWWHAIILRLRSGDQLEWAQIVSAKSAWERSGRPVEWALPGTDPEAEAERTAIQHEADPL